MESHYILKDNVNSNSLRELLLNFTNNNLSRSYKSVTNLKVKSNVMVENGKNKNSTKILLEELNSVSFLPTVMKENKVSAPKKYRKSRVLFAKNQKHVG